MTRRLRAGGVLGINEIVYLHRVNSPLTVASSSTAPATTTVFSSHKESSGTKPTSAGTSYLVNGKDQPVKEYASSLSASHGSGSDTELEAIQDNFLFGVGGQFVDGPRAARTLKGPARTVKRPRAIRRPRAKKPVVMIHQNGGASASEDEHPAVNQVTRRDGRHEAKYLRQRRSIPDDQLNLVEEGRVSESPALSLTLPPKPLSRARFNTIVGLVIATVLTFVLSAFAAHYTGKGRMRCTKGIIFSATAIISCFTVLAMVTARRALQEALLAGLLESFFGIALVVEIHDFM
ncbi:uncharacterized protein BDR25DRAFT_55893 [Lindgomyces ingoldianus]|uniref:Uncharacterized protein n=1 Tax=Lindgomyces ingoldianus TaxID=673940 RepID=A0ACB6QNJ8_9PLEO|nr:uncharacterized protein BDR25DRAFT_55893 [Lindgomyces ingoldianus]KAF2468568.1 hypothetical protein BDR25DRAFT_55893 [Lindgomyces ingoldianus]